MQLPKPSLDFFTVTQKPPVPPLISVNIQTGSSEPHFIGKTSLCPRNVYTDLSIQSLEHKVTSVSPTCLWFRQRAHHTAQYQTFQPYQHLIPLRSMLRRCHFLQHKWPHTEIAKWNTSRCCCYSRDIFGSPLLYLYILPNVWKIQQSCHYFPS